MASIALGFAGQALGAGFGPIGAKVGGFIGSQLGGLIDNALFPSKQPGPRVTDKSVTASTYGSAIPRLYGPGNRLAPNIIWVGDLIEKKGKTTGGKGAPSNPTYSYSRSVALMFAAGRPVRTIRKLLANGKVIMENPVVGETPPDGNGVVYIPRSAGKQAVFASLRFYPGNGIQPIDPTIEAIKGVGNTPAYRQTCYIVIDTLQLADFGNRLPNFEAFLEADAEPVSVGGVVLDICVACGISHNDVSTSSLRGKSMEGFKISNQTQGNGAIQPLALAFAFDMSDQGGSLRFVSRGRGSRGRILSDDYGGHSANDDPPEKIRFDRTEDIALPLAASLTFIDAERNFQPNTARSQRYIGASSNDLTAEVAVVLDPTAAQGVCDRLLWEPWVSRRSVNLTLTDRFITLRPGDIWTLDSPDPMTNFKVTRVTRSFSGLLETEWRADDQTLYEFTAVGQGATIPDNVVRLPGETLLLLLDLPLLASPDDPYGFYWAAAGSGNGWRGADIQRSVDGGVTFTTMSPTRQETTVGTVATALPDGPVTGYDTTHTITVTLHRTDMELESVSDDEIDAGFNAFYLGGANSAQGEILQFRDAELVAPGVYDLTNLVRGLRGTEWTAGLHGANENFVLLSQSTIGRSAFGAVDIGLARVYKGVSVLTDAADAADVNFTNTGVGLRPFAPNHLADDRVITPADIVFTWDRRARGGGDLRGNGSSLPYLDGPDAYRVNIMNAAGTVVVRTIDVTAPTATYTAAQQATDFPGGLPVDLIWRVAQASNIYAPGFSPWATAKATA